MSKILLVEDNEGISEGLRFAFVKSEHELIVAKNVKEAERAVAESNSLVLVLLDINLPDGDGFELYKNLLKKKQLPTIFLTARDEEEDIVRGLELGGEDYICKPFSVKELMARVNRALSRFNTSKIVTVKDISYDLEKMDVFSQERIIKLSSLELKIFDMLMRNINKVVSRNDIIDLIWDATGNDVYEHTVTVYIKRLRQKLGTDIIETVKGIGYRIDQ